MKWGNEVEIKYQGIVDQAAVLDLVRRSLPDGWELLHYSPYVLTDTYFDTADLALLRQDISLRARRMRFPFKTKYPYRINMKLPGCEISPWSEMGFLVRPEYRDKAETIDLLATRDSGLRGACAELAASTAGFNSIDEACFVPNVRLNTYREQFEVRSGPISDPETKLFGIMFEYTVMADVRSVDVRMLFEGGFWGFPVREALPMFTTHGLEIEAVMDPSNIQRDSLLHDFAAVLTKSLANIQMKPTQDYKYKVAAKHLMLKPGRADVEIPAVRHLVEPELT
jgi:hypothetical protein